MKEPYVVGVDPPRAWTAWSSKGPLAWCQHSGDSLGAARKALAELDNFITLAGKPTHIRVERCFGTQRAEDGAQGTASIQTQLLSSEVVGWWLARAEDRASFAERVYPAEWRGTLGLPSADRVRLKHLAVALAEKVTTELDLQPMIGPRGGIKVDASESMCISMSAWISHIGWSGVLQTWRSTGRFK